MEKLRGRTESLVCDNCGVQFLRPAWRKKSPAGVFCGRSCRYKSHRGVRAPNWRGGRQMSAWGYWLAWDSGRGRYVQEHRLVVERHLGRRLDRREVVHHLNGDQLDNRIENLHTCSQAEHLRLHRSK